MSQTPAPSPPARRADAARNRGRILSAARAAFADPAADVSMAEVARRAGIGSATLYRNFANRRELLEAVYVDEIDAICAAATSPSGVRPGANLEAWLRRFYAYFTNKRLIASELLELTDTDDPVFGAGLARVLDASRPLLEAARNCGEVRADLSIEQILELIVAVAKIPGDEDHKAPILQAALDALRPTPAT